MAKNSSPNKDFHSGMVKKSISIKASKTKVWSKISNIIGLPSWVIDVKKAVFQSRIKRGIGAIRRLTFNDGNIVEEHVVGWKNEEYFSYIAVRGLPLRAYHATLSISSKTPKTVNLSWQSYFNSKKMTEKEFSEFVSFLGLFYSQSLKNLKKILES